VLLRHSMLQLLEVQGRTERHSNFTIGQLKFFGYIINQQDATLAVLIIKNYKYALYVSDALCAHHQDKHQRLLLQFIVLLMMDAKGVQNMYSTLVVFNKHNTARVAILLVYYIL